MTARIAPLDPPYAPEVQAAFDAVMRGAPPLALFRTLGRNPRVYAVSYTLNAFRIPLETGAPRFPA